MQHRGNQLASWVLAAAAVVQAFGCTVAAAQPDQTTLAGQLELARLVDIASQRLKLNVEYDASALKGVVTLRLDAGIGDDELWLLVNRVLAARGFTTVRMPGERAYSVVKLADAASLATVASERAPGDEPAPGFMVTAVRVQHRHAKDLVEPLSKVLSKPSGSVAVLGDGGLLLLADVSSRVEQALAILKLLDAPGARTVVEQVPVRNISAVQMAALVAQVAAKREAVSGEKVPGEVVAAPDGTSVLLVMQETHRSYWRSLFDELDRRERVESVTYTPRHFAAREVARLAEQTVKDFADDRWKLVIDDLTGSLVVTATPTQHEAFRALIERLDAAPVSARRPARSFVIKNRSVSEVKAILEQLIQAGAVNAGAESLPGATPAPATDRTAAVIPLPPPPAASAVGARGSQQASAQMRRPVPGGETDTPLSLTVDEGTNTLIAVGEPRLLSQIESLLPTIDVRQPQVMLEVLMVTLTQGQTLDLGVELEKLRINDDLFIRLSSLFGLGTRGESGDRTAGDAAGFTGVVLSPGDFSVVVRALQTLNDGRSVSMPKLLVGNNQQASLDSVVEQPYASVNASTTVSTTSFGGTQDAGTVVTIKPQIAEGDHLVLQYSVSLSSFLGAASSPTLPPARQQNRVQSVATIPDGFTVVVGGIELENKSKGVSQVPLLGDIPILGEVFKNRNNTDSRSRFFVFIRANVLRGRGFDDLKYLSARDAEAAAIDDGWPDVEPRIIR